MDPFEPIINLVILLSVLSLSAERLTNVFKMRSADLRIRTNDKSLEQEREQKIQIRSMLIGIGFAILVKADLFSILTHLDDPWTTIGWVRVSGSQWVQSVALQNLGAALYAVAGCVITGIAMGFGSKFWHEILEGVFELRTIARSKGSDLITTNESSPSIDVATSGSGNDGE